MSFRHLNMQNEHSAHYGASASDVTHSVAPNLSEVVSTLITTVQNLQGRVAAHDELLAKMNRLEKENHDLRSSLAAHNQEIQRLRGLLPPPGTITSPSTAIASAGLAGPTKSTGPGISRDSRNTKDTPQIHPKKTNSKSRDSSNLNSDHARVGPTWVDVIRRAPSARKLAAAVRAFSPADPSAPSGYEYVYLPRKRKFSRQEIRANLRRLGIDPSRLLDISFPARSCVGLLVHTQYSAELLSLLAAAKVAPLLNFDPVDPINLADPKYAGDSNTVRSAKILQIHSDRCVGVLSHVRPHLVPAIGAGFVSAGWISEENLKSSLATAFPSPGNKRLRVHHRDEDMEDARSIFTNDDSSEEETPQ